MLCFICFPLKSLIKNEKRERVEKWEGGRAGGKRG